LNDAQLEIGALRMAMKQENGELRAANKGLTANIATLTEQARVQQTKLGDLEHIKEGEKKEVNRLRGQLAAFKKEAEKKIREKRDELERQKQELNDAQLEIGALRLAMKQENGELRAANKELTANNAILTEQARVQQTKLEDLEHKTEAEFESQAEVLKSYRNDIQRQSNVVASLHKDLDASRLEIARQSDLVASLRRDLDHAQNDTRTQSQVEDDLRKALESLTKDEAEARRRLSSDLESSQLEVQRQAELVNSLSLDLEKAQSEVCAKNEIARDLKSELAAVRKDEAESRLETERQVALVVALRLDLEHAISDLGAKGEIASGLEKQLAKSKEEKTESDLHFVSQLESSQQEIARQIDIITSLRQDLEHARLDVDAKSQLAASREKEVGVLGRELNSYKEKVVGLNEIHRLLGEELKKTRNEATANGLRAREKVREVEKKAKDLEEIRRAREETLEETTVELRNAQRVLKERDMELQALRGNFTSAQEKGEKRQKEVVELKEQISRLQKEVVHLEEEMESAQNGGCRSPGGHDRNVGTHYHFKSRRNNTKG
jgi:chromosome segregation ATPase